MSENSEAVRDRTVEVTQEQIADYVKHLEEANYGKGSISLYKHNLEELYAALPKKQIGRTTLNKWREQLMGAGYAARTINLRINVANSFLEYLDLREFQLMGNLIPEEGSAPELTRWEYLRLLQTAKALEKERTYLLVKVFAMTGLPVQTLDKLTVAAARRGRFTVEHKLGRQQVRVPRSLQGELLDYARRVGCASSGPVFLTRTGKPVHRNYVNAELRRLCLEAGVPEEKGSPRCLRRLYLRTREEIEDSVRAQVERSYDQMIEREQLTVGWSV